MKISSDQRPVTIFLSSFGGGGAQKVAVTLANEFVRLQNRPVEILVINKEGPFLSLVDARVKIVELKSRRTLMSLFELVNYKKSRDPIAMLSVMRYLNIISSISQFLSRSDCKLVLREANILRRPQGNVRTKLRLLSRKLLMKTFYRFSDLVISNSNDTKSSLVDSNVIPAEKSVVISNPIPIQQIQEKVNFVDDKTHILSSNFICAVGRLEPQKGFDTLIRAFSKISDKTLQLYILGEGKQRDYLENIAVECNVGTRVKFLGFVSNPFQIIASSKAFVLSSRWEGFGNVVVEALACGVPVIATACKGGPTEILDHGRFGRLVGVDNIEQLTHAIEQELINPTSNPTERVQRALEFDSKEIAARYLEVLLP